MKFPTGSALVLMLALGATFPAFAETIVPSSEIQGEVESIDGSTLTLRNQDGTSSSFAVDPAVISAYELEPGRSVMINGAKLNRGVITGVDDHTVKVRHDNGDVETYILHRESRRFLSLGDRVVVNARGQVVQESRFRLSASEITPVYSFVAATRTETQLASSNPVPAPEPIAAPEVVPIPTPEPPTSFEPVQGLW